jgi:hypothetical protein
MKRRKPAPPPEDLTADIERARAERQEAEQLRATLATSDPGFWTAVVAKRASDEFGDQLQVTFTRRR